MRNTKGYIKWLDAGNTSEYLERVRAVVDETPRTRREIAEMADVSYNFASLATDVLVELGEAEFRGYWGRAHKGWNPPKLYARKAK